jgi:hypothetical protein
MTPTHITPEDEPSGRLEIILLLLRGEDRMRIGRVRKPGAVGGR